MIYHRRYKGNDLNTNENIHVPYTQCNDIQKLVNE